MEICFAEHVFYLFLQYLVSILQNFILSFFLFKKILRFYIKIILIGYG